MIDYTLSGLDITSQAYNIAIMYRNGVLEERKAKEVLEEYFDWLVKRAKTKFNKKIKRPTFAYFVRATPNF